MLTDIDIPSCYFTATSERLLNELYMPALAESSLYQRGVAYFSIEFLMRLLDGIVPFVKNGGVIHLVTSVELDRATIESFAKGYLLSEEDIESRLIESIAAYQKSNATSSEIVSAKLDVVANMIASRNIVIKVAYVPSGIYHEKIGLFTDAQGNTISFIGSANATINAYHHNFETIDIFGSWESPRRVAEHRKHFANLWNNAIENLSVVPFPEAVEKRLLSEFKRSADLESSLEKLEQLMNPRKTEGSSDRAKLRPYQEEAIEQFVQNGYRHFLEMATGTGKTFTAVKAIEKMSDVHQILNVIILVPLKDLQKQWTNSIAKMLNRDHRIFRFGGGGKGDANDYNLSAASESVKTGKAIAIGVCVYDTFFSRAVDELSPVAGELLLIVDEAHNLTPGQLKKLKHFARYRLGLSATPERHNPKETQSIFDYFLPEGVESFKFGLKEAIEQGFLSPYEYYPIPVSLTEDELFDYRKLTQAIGVAQAIYDQDPSRENQKRLDDLKMARSRIVKKAMNKLSLLKAMVDSREYDFSNAVVFAGPGEIDCNDGEGPQKLLDLVTMIISRSVVRRYYPAKYTSGEDDRAERLENFTDGLTDALVAIKCFDEGLDVPALDKIYLMASDASKRQTIQRRGRVLRISRDTGKVKARIYDMVAGEGDGYSFVPLATECPRVAEYASLALNPEDSKGILRFYNGDSSIMVGDVNSEE